MKESREESDIILINENIRDIIVESNTKDNNIINNSFSSEDEHQSAQMNSPNETMDIDKSNIINEFGEMIEEIDEYPTLEKFNEKHISEEEYTKKRIIPGTKRRCVIIMFYIIFPILSILNIIAAYEFITITKTIFKIVINALGVKLKLLWGNSDSISTFSIEDYNQNYNFFVMFYIDTKIDKFDFNLLMITGVLGTLLLKKWGFRISVLIATLINVIAICLIILCFSDLDYDIDNNAFSWSTIGFLFFIFILIYTGTGCFALLSLQVIIGKRDKFNNYIKELNEEADKKIKEMKQRKKSQRNLSFDDWITQTNEQNLLPNISEYNISESVINEQNKLFENDNNIVNNQTTPRRYTVFIEKKSKDSNDIKETEEENQNDQEENDYEEENDDNNKIKYLGSFFIICIIAISSYLIKDVINTSFKEKDEENIKEYINIAGCNGNYLCYKNIEKDKSLSKNNYELFKQIISKFFKNSRSSFITISIICVGLIILSIILYSIFDRIFIKEEEIKKDEEKEEKSDKIKKNWKYREFCGYIKYTLEIDDNSEVPKCKCCILIGAIIRNCFASLINSFAQYFCNIIHPPNEENKNVRIMKINNEIFKKIKTNEYTITYKKKNKYEYINDFLNGEYFIKILPYLIGFFFLQLVTLGIEKQHLKLQNEKDLFVPSNDLRKLYQLNQTGFFMLSNGKENDNKNNNKNNILKFGNNWFLKKEDYHEYISYLVTFVSFLILTVSDNMVRNFLLKESKNNKQKKQSQQKKYLDNINKLSSGILGGINIILLSVSLYALFFYIFYFFDSENENFKNINYYLFPILLNKYYYFTILFYYMRLSQQLNKYDLIKGSTFISIIINILQYIIIVIRDYLNSEIIFYISMPLCVIHCLLFLGKIFVVVYQAIKKGNCCKSQGLFNNNCCNSPCKNKLCYHTCFDFLNCFDFFNNCSCCLCCCGCYTD